MKVITTENEICQRCGERLLNEGAIVWLELDTYKGTYHQAGVVAPEDSQGWFAFGADCAKHPNRRFRGR